MAFKGNEIYKYNPEKEFKLSRGGVEKFIKWYLRYYKESF